MNNITIAGPLGRDAELKTLPDGTSVLQFAVADSQGREKPTIWWDCALFGKRAETLGQYLTKGQQVAVSGSVSQREYTKQDGTPVKAYSIRVQDVALQGRPSERQDQKPVAKAAPNKVSRLDDMDDDIPFN